jgi:hypothetical protein
MSNPDRLYELLPAVYRQQDEDRGKPLQGLLRVIGEQVDVVEADIRRLYENWFIETCDDWVVPYIGDLLGFQLVHEAGQPGDPRIAPGRALEKILIPRREVAHVIAARRRRGTLALLEELARGVAGWPARAVEFYQLLGVTQALNQLQLQRGRTVDVRDVAALDLLGGAFNRTAHTVDVRRMNSGRRQGRSSIPGVGLFVWRLRAYRVSDTPASCIEEEGEHAFTFSALGNNSPLFTHPQPEPEPTHIADELNVPAPIRRRALAAAVDAYYGDVQHDGKSLAIRAPGWPGSNDDGWVPATAIVVADLRDWDYEPEDNHVAVDPRCGRIVFPLEQTPPNGVWVSYYYGFSADIGGGEYRRPISQQAKVVPMKAAADELGARLNEWKQAMPQHAVIELTESGIYADPIRIEIPAGHTLQIRAAKRTRPIIRLIDRKANQSDALTVILGAGSRFVLDGLLITGRSVQFKTAQPAKPPEKEKPEKPDKRRKASKAAKAENVAAAAVEEPPSEAPPLGAAHVDVIIRHCTLVPGWDMELDCTPCQPTKPSLELSHLQGRVSIEHSIVGAIRVLEDRVRAEPVELRISDSAVDATSPERDALSASGGVAHVIAHAALTIARSTVFGELHTHAIRLAENCIFIGDICVARRQIGCVRFCYVTPGSRTPRRYECQPDLAESAATAKLGAGASAEEKARAIARAQGRVTPRFNSMRYGSPAYCQLAASCADEIASGADDESEMGVFHDLFQPQRAINLRARLDEFTPAGMDAGIIYVT